MILGRPTEEPQASAGAHRTTLDDLFRRAGVRRPDAPALIDPPNREAITGRRPRTITYAEADRIVTAIAVRLRRLNLPQDAIVAIQMPNVVDSVLALLGVMRAGMIAMPLPLLWRKAELATALARVGARAMITVSRMGDLDTCELVMQAAAQVFSVRHVCAFGPSPGDGVVPFDDLFMPDKSAVVPHVERSGGAAAHVAVVTWDVTTDGLVPVARNHGELLAGGLPVLIEGAITQDASILSPIATSSFAGIATVIIPWLICGGTLVLHHPFDPAAFMAQGHEHGCSTMILPGSLAATMAEAGLIEVDERLSSVIALWRSPERLAASPIWTSKRITLIDVQAFGEVGILAARRGPDGVAVTFAPGTMSAGSGPGAVPVAEIRRSDAGTLAMRGPMVPRHPFPPGAETGSIPFLRVGHDGFVDTGFGCRADAATGALMVTRPPAGTVTVGGYRFLMREIEDLLGQIEPGSTVAALPDPTLSSRLAGSAADRNLVRESLIAADVNPLVVAAFRERATERSREPDASAA